MNDAKQRLSIEELLQRLEDLGVAMHAYADSRLDAGNGEAEPVIAADEESLKTGE